MRLRLILLSCAALVAFASAAVAAPDEDLLRKAAGSPYGETTIRNVLRMSSGVAFNETYDGKDDLARFARLRGSQGSIEALRAFTEREVGQGTRFHYASSETVILAVLLRAVTGGT